MIQPKVVERKQHYEVWLFRSTLFFADIFSDGVVQLRHAIQAPSGVYLSVAGTPLNSHNTHDRDRAIRWLNENVG